MLPNLTPRANETPRENDTPRANETPRRNETPRSISEEPHIDEPKPEEPKLHEILKNTPCPTHGLNYQYVCYDPTCFESDGAFLCQDCLDTHPTHHKHVNLSYIFSDMLITEFKRYRGKIEEELLACQEKETEVTNMLDEMFDHARKTIFKLLQEAHEKVKKIFMLKTSALSTLDTFEKDLSQFNFTNIATNDDLKAHIKSFETKLNEFREIRRLGITPVAPIADQRSKKILDSTQEKLGSLSFTVRKYLDKELNFKENPTPKPEVIDIFDFYTKNTKAALSSKDIHTLKEMKAFTPNQQLNQWIFKLLLLDDGRFVTSSNDRNIQVWRIDKATPDQILTGHTGIVRNIIKLESGKLASASYDKTIKIWDLDDGLCEKTFSGYPGFVFGLVELPNETLIGGGSNQIRFWDLHTTSKVEGDACLRILPNKGDCYAIVLLNSEEMACSSGQDINIYKISESDVPLKKFSGHTGAVWDLLLHVDKQRLLSISDDTTMKIWNVQDCSCIRSFQGSSYNYKMVFFRENIVATAYDNGEIKFWDVDTGECIRTLKKDGPNQEVFGLVVDEQGVLISYGKGGVLYWSN